MATDTIRLLKPNIFAKGSEYRDASKDRTGAISAEEHVVEEVGGRIAQGGPTLEEFWQYLVRGSS